MTQNEAPPSTSDSEPVFHHQLGLSQLEILKNSETQKLLRDSESKSQHYESTLFCKGLKREFSVLMVMTVVH